MAPDDPQDPSADWLAPGKLAQRARVRPRTVYNWRDRYGWKQDAQGRFRWADVVHEKLFRHKDIIAKHEVPEDRAARPEQYGVSPSADGLFSLADVAILKGEHVQPTLTRREALSTDAHLPARGDPRPPGVPFHGGAVDLPEEFHTRRDRSGVLDWYIRNQKRPCDLPDWFWDTPEEPEFVPPAGVCFTEIGERTWDDENRPIIPLHITAFWTPDGQYWPAEETQIVGHEATELLRDIRTTNELYRQAQVEWHVEYVRRRRP